QSRADEPRGVVDAATAGATGAAGVDLVAVVLVVGDPIDVVEGAVECLHGVVVVVPELLQALLLGGQALVALGEDVPPGLIAAVAQVSPAGVGAARADGQAQGDTGQDDDPLHRDSFPKVRSTK